MYEVFFIEHLACTRMSHNKHQHTCVARKANTPLHLPFLKKGFHLNQTVSFSILWNVVSPFLWVWLGCKAFPCFTFLLHFVYSILKFELLMLWKTIEKKLKKRLNVLRLSLADKWLILCSLMMWAHFTYIWVLNLEENIYKMKMYIRSFLSNLCASIVPNWSPQAWSTSTKC